MSCFRGYPRWPGLKRPWQETDLKRSVRVRRAFLPSSVSLPRRSLGDLSRSGPCHDLLRSGQTGSLWEGR